MGLRRAGSQHEMGVGGDQIEHTLAECGEAMLFRKPDDPSLPGVSNLIQYWPMFSIGISTILMFCLIAWSMKYAAWDKSSRQLASAYRICMGFRLLTSARSIPLESFSTNPGSHFAHIPCDVAR